MNSRLSSSTVDIRRHEYDGPREIGGRGRIVGLTVAFLLMIALRFALMTHDPPDWLSWSSGVYTDEGFYTLDARHRVLFGTLAPGNFHDSYVSPVLSAMQTGWFTWFGVSQVSARSLSVILSLLGLLMFWDMVRRRSGNTTANIALVFLGLSAPYLFYNCLALQETPAVFWVIAALWLIEIGRTSTTDARMRVAAVCSGLALVAAFGCKSLSLICLPAIWLDLRQCGSAQKVAFALGMTVGGAGYLLSCWLPHHAEIGRMSVYYLRHQFMPHTPMSLWLNVRRAIFDPDKGLVIYFFQFMTVPWIAVLRGASTKSRADSAAVWLVTGVLFCACFSYAPSRYYVLFLPALCWLAALSLEKAPRRLWMVAVAAHIGLSGVIIGLSLRQAGSTVRTGTKALDRLVAGDGVSRGSSPLVVGEFAPELCIGTGFRSAPMQPGLSNDDHPIERLRPDYITVCRSPYWSGWWRTHYPSLPAPDRLAGVVTLDGPPSTARYTVDIYRVN